MTDPKLTEAVEVTQADREAPRSHGAASRRLLEGVRMGCSYPRHPSTGAIEMNDLSALIAERDALNARIALMEEGIRKAAYDASMCQQLVTVNENRECLGKAKLTMGQFVSGCFVEEQSQ